MIPPPMITICCPDDMVFAGVRLRKERRRVSEKMVAVGGEMKRVATYQTIQILVKIDSYLREMFVVSLDIGIDKS